MALKHFITLGLVLAIQAVSQVKSEAPTIFAPKPIPLSLNTALGDFNNQFGKSPSPSPSPLATDVPFDLDASLSDFINSFGQAADVSRPLSPSQIPLPLSRPGSPTDPNAEEDDELFLHIDAPTTPVTAPITAPILPVPATPVAPVPATPATPVIAPVVPVPATPTTPVTAPVVPVPATPTTPTTVAPATPVTAPAKEEGLIPLTKFGQDVFYLIINRRYKAIRALVNAEFEAGMAKVRNDLARLKLRKITVVNQTSNPDSIDEDLQYLTEIVGDAEKILAGRYNARKQLFNRLVKEFINRRMANYSEKMANAAASLIDHIAHDPIAEAKKMFRVQKKIINNEMSV